MSHAPSILELTNVGYSREGTVVLQDLSISLTIKRCGIVGRNGSGKSTLARLIAGLVAPDAGTLRLNSFDPAKDRRMALREIGILFQNPDHQLIFPTVIEEISFGLMQLGQTKPEAEENARATLATFDKNHWEAVYVNTLSQGQKHLLCLMAVVAMGPRLLILDEPFAGLDIPTRAQLSRYLEYFEGNLIHITHNPDDLNGYDQALWLDQGQVRQSGEAGQVIEDYIATMNVLGDADDIADLSR